MAMADRVVRSLGGSVLGRRIAILGVTFKPDTDDVRRPSAGLIIPALQTGGATIRAHDPAGMKAAANSCRMWNGALTPTMPVKAPTQ